MSKNQYHECPVYIQGDNRDVHRYIWSIRRILADLNVSDAYITSITNWFSKNILIMDAFSAFFPSILTPQVLVQAGWAFLLFRFLLGLGMVYSLFAMVFYQKSKAGYAIIYPGVNPPFTRIQPIEKGHDFACRKQKGISVQDDNHGQALPPDRASRNDTTEIIFNDFYTWNSKPFSAKKVYYKNLEEF